MIIFPDVTIVAAYAIPHSLKHTPKYGEHCPIDSPILLNEMANLFLDKATLRVGDELKINFQNDNVDCIYVEFLSQTTSIIDGQECLQYREIGGILHRDGIVSVEHCFPHHDINRFEMKKELLEKTPYSYIIKVNRKSTHNN